MYHTLTKHIRLFVPFIFVLLIAGCSFTKPGISLTEKKYETDTSSVEVQIPEFKNFSDKEFEEKLNAEYNDTINKWLEDFSEKSTKNSSGSEKCLFRITQTLKFNSAPFLSLVGDVYFFTEGIHGTSSRLVKNIDTVKNTELKLSDLFSDSAYETLINRKITEMLETNAEEYHDLWEKPVLSSIHQEFFYLSDDGLVIFYPPYELSYYARGFVEFCIPYSELSGYLKPEYKSLAKL